MKTGSFLERLDHERIVAAIRAAETRSHGEVRVHVSGRKVDDPAAAAAAVFEKLGMTATAERNGVLIYVAPASQRFAVLGDTGIHDRCGPAFWDGLAAGMAQSFRAGNYTDGIVGAVEAVAAVLAEHYPRTTRGDVNELPDELTED